MTGPEGPCLLHTRLSLSLLLQQNVLWHRGMEQSRGGGLLSSQRKSTAGTGSCDVPAIATISSSLGIPAKATISLLALLSLLAMISLPCNPRAALSLLCAEHRPQLPC